MPITENPCRLQHGEDMPTRGPLFKANIDLWEINPEVFNFAEDLC